MNLKSIVHLAFAMLALPITHSLAGMASHHKWTHSEINVCFAEKETRYFVTGMKEGSKRNWKLKEKKLVQEILEKEFTTDRTGYTFVGFQDCRDTENIDVVVGVRPAFSKETLAGVKGIATTGMLRNRITTYDSAYGAVILSSLSINRTTVVHEFGHILGLMHEHTHPEAPVSACPYYLEKAHFSYNTIITDFDKESVMNYCNTLFGGSNKGLSAGDQELIWELYHSKY